MLLNELVHEPGTDTWGPAVPLSFGDQKPTPKADFGRIKAKVDSCHGSCGCSLSPVSVQMERLLVKASELSALFFTPGGILVKSMVQKPCPACWHDAQNKARCSASLLLIAVLGLTDPSPRPTPSISVSLQDAMQCTDFSKETYQPTEFKQTGSTANTGAS